VANSREVNQALEYARNIRQSHASQGWSDPEFPHSGDSICKSNEVEGDFGRFRKECTWKRAADLYDNPQIFAGGVDPGDIHQTNVGSCYFLASLSALAEFGTEIKDCFSEESQYYNDAGIYTVFFYIGGKKTPVQVDDWIPCYGSKPLSTTTKSEEIWAILLEKAWAKLHGSY